MNFQSTDKEELYELCDVFEAFLLEHHISFEHVDMREDKGILSFLFCNDPARARSVEFEAERCMGLDMEYIAAEVLNPILPRLKAFK